MCYLDEHHPWGPVPATSTCHSYKTRDKQPRRGGRERYERADDPEERHRTIRHLICFSRPSVGEDMMPRCLGRALVLLTLLGGP
jgi:hypothetical protein